MRKFIEASPEGFETFWAIWRTVMRNTDGKGLAREAYRKQLLRGTMPEDIIDGASWFVRNLTEKTRDYVPLSATWINRETFDGLCEKERDYQSRLAQASQAQENVVPIKPVSTYKPAFLRQYEAERKESQA